MLANADITIFNRKKINRNEVWLRTNLYGVNFHGEAELIVGDKELQAAEKYIIRIPDDVRSEKIFVDNKTFKALAVDEADNFYTVQKGDIIINGIVNEDIESRAQLADKYDILTILSVSDNRRIGSFTSHIKLVCGT